MSSSHASHPSPNHDVGSSPSDALHPPPPHHDHDQPLFTPQHPFDPSPSPIHTIILPSIPPSPTPLTSIVDMMVVEGEIHIDGDIYAAL